MKASRLAPIFIIGLIGMSGLAACASQKVVASSAESMIATAVPIATAAPTVPANATSLPADADTEPTDNDIEIARPSNAGNPGEAANLSGDIALGAALYAKDCQVCHGAAGRAGISNPGTTDGTVPTLNPIDETMMNKDPKVYAYNLDLFIQNGSTPAGSKPTLSMPAWGKTGALTQQQIADVISYIMSLNPPSNK